MRRGGTTDLGVTVFRDGRFILALGAVVGMELGPYRSERGSPAACLRGLPKTRPTDLYVRFSLDGVTTTVHEGSTSSTSHGICMSQRCSRSASLANGHSWQLPGTRDGLTAEMLVESTKVSASGRIDITR